MFKAVAILPHASVAVNIILLFGISPIQMPNTTMHSILNGIATTQTIQFSSSMSLVTHDKPVIEKMPASIFLESVENLNYIYFYCLFALAVAFVSSSAVVVFYVHCALCACHTRDGKLSSSGQVRRNKRKI